MTTKQELEDLYLPFKPKRRTKGQIAREVGIEPLADKLFADPRSAVEAQAFLKPPETLDQRRAGADFSTDAVAVLDGVRDMLSNAGPKTPRWCSKPARMAVGRGTAAAPS